ncbi:MAG: hypothetical protein ABIO79_09690 [Ferruginibacter sp.]
MTQETTPDVLTLDEKGKPKIPSGLNILTILTFIGCAVFGLFTLLMPVIYKFLLNMMDKAASSGKEFSEKELADMEKGRAAIELFTNNMVPTMIIGMVGIVLCFMGALWMRKFKKDGYWMYVAGELLPLVAGFFLLGSEQYTGITSYILGIGMPILFVILYTTQRKYLTK